MRTDSPFGTPETKEQIEETLASIEAVLEKKERDERIFEEAHVLSLDFKKFIVAAWEHVEPNVLFMDNWHIDAIVEHLTAVSMSKITKLQIWVPPGSAKSTLVSILWPAWEWTHDPALRYFTASYDIALAYDFTSQSRDLMLSHWYQERWGNQFTMLKRDESHITNNEGGYRVATSPVGRGTGKHGHRIILDDPLNAKDANLSTRAKIDATNKWYSGALSTRKLAGVAEIIIMQRLHENDTAAHALSFSPHKWDVLCLPEEYERNHPFAWKGDPRKKEGELMWPQRRDQEVHDDLVAQLGRHVAAGQLQQRPAAREGSILLRADWRYFPPAFIDAAEDGGSGGRPDTSKLPKFGSILYSWDTSFKDGGEHDFVAGGCWGIHGANRYLLRTFHKQASLSATKTAMKEMRAWAIKRWPRVPHRVLIEKQSNGVQIIADLKREITGVIPIIADSSKTARAEAAEPDFNSHNVFVPGAIRPDMSDYDPGGTPAWVQEVVEECSSFPRAEHDDLVDMVTMALNYQRTRSTQGVRTSSALSGITPLGRSLIPGRRV